MDISNVLLNEHKSEEEARASEDKFYKAKYRELKRKLKDVVSTNEYLKSELRHSQKKLQFVEEDKGFLLDRLLVYEKPALSPHPTPDLSDSDPESSSPSKRKGPGRSPLHPGGVTFSSAFSKLRPPFVPQKQKRKSRKAAGVAGLLGGPADFLGSPVGLSLDSEDSSGFALGSLATYPPPEEEEDEEEEEESE